MIIRQAVDPLHFHHSPFRPPRRWFEWRILARWRSCLCISLPLLYPPYRIEWLYTDTYYPRLTISSANIVITIIHSTTRCSCVSVCALENVITTKEILAHDSCLGMMRGQSWMIADLPMVGIAIPLPDMVCRCSFHGVWPCLLGLESFIISSDARQVSDYRLLWVMICRVALKDFWANSNAATINYRL